MPQRRRAAVSDQRAAPQDLGEALPWQVQAALRLVSRPFVELGSGSSRSSIENRPLPQNVPPHGWVKLKPLSISPMVCLPGGMTPGEKDAGSHPAPYASSNPSPFTVASNPFIGLTTCQAPLVHQVFAVAATDSHRSPT